MFKDKEDFMFDNSVTVYMTSSRIVEYVGFEN